MLEQDVAEPESQDGKLSNKCLQITKVLGGYAKSLGLLKGDIIIGLDGDVFYGDSEDFKSFFEIDDDDDDYSSEHSAPIMTVKRNEAFFNVICYKKILCKFEQIDNPHPDPSEQVQQILETVKNGELSEYLIYHDNKKNAQLLLRSKSLLAMVAPPLWFLNQRVPEAMLASILGGLATLTVHWILGVLYYVILCLYIGREQLNLAISFMSYKRMLYMQPIASANEFEAQCTALAIDEDLFFERPVEGLVQKKKRSKRKVKPNTSNLAVEYSD